MFWTSGDVCPGFQSQGGSRLHAFEVSNNVVSTSGELNRRRPIHVFK